MNVLITGGAGFIGSHLTEKLLTEGHRVWVVDNFSTGFEENSSKFSENPNYSFYQMSVESSEFLNEFLNLSEKLDRVYDLACPTGVPNIEKLGLEMMVACSVGTMNVLEVAKKHDADFLHTSSSEAYGDPLVSPQGEDYTGNVDPLGPRANYEEGKRFSETLTKLFVDKFGVRARLVRLFNVYGPNMGLTDERVVPRFGKQALLGEPLSVHGDGSQSRTLCHVDDILNGFELVISKGKPGEVYNLGSDKALTMKELAELIVKLSGSKSVVGCIPRPDHDHQSRMPKLDKIRALGWQEQVELEKGLRETLEAFKQKLPIAV